MVNTQLSANILQTLDQTCYLDTCRPCVNQYSISLNALPRHFHGFILDLAQTTPNYRHMHNLSSGCGIPPWYISYMSTQETYSPFLLNRDSGHSFFLELQYCPAKVYIWHFDQKLFFNYKYRCRFTVAVSLSHLFY